MAQQIQVTEQKTQQSVHYGINDQPFYKGVVQLVAKSKLPMTAVAKARNLIQVENGYFSKRPGTEYYGTANANVIDGGGVHYEADGDPHLLRVCNGTIQRSLDDGATWSNCTGITLTAGVKTLFLQGGFSTPQTWIVNGIDNIARYDGTTTLLTYSNISTPTGLNVTHTGAAGATYTHYYTVVAVNNVGFTAAATEDSITSLKMRTEFTASIYNDVTWSTVSGALRYDVYYGDQSGKLFWIASTTALSYRDDGTAPINYLTVAPTDNTTQGPKFSDLEYIDNRIWGCKDPGHPSRVYWAGSGDYAGYFSPYYGGGFIDLEPGSSSTVMKVIHYRDNKGTSYATILTKDPDGNGGIWQVGLSDVVTDADISYVVPSAYKLVGSKGTDSSFSVVKVLNDIQYFNRNGQYALRSKPQMLNFLSTDELTAPIRPFIGRITPSALDKVASIYYEAKVLVSVPIDGSTTNNRIMSYDTERNNWNPEAFTYGVERFFLYSDTNGERHLLGWLPGGKQFIEISKNFEGDFGTAFRTELETGLMHTTKDRFSFFKAKDFEVEFSDGMGSADIEINGYDRRRGYGTIAAITLDLSTTSFSGWSSIPFSSALWSSTAETSDIVSEISTKKYVKVNREINNFSFTIITDDISSKYTGPRVLQVYGKPKKTKKPSAWKVRRN